jgi:hypothetical protein
MEGAARARTYLQLNSLECQEPGIVRYAANYADLPGSVERALLLSRSARPSNLEEGDDL